jgi:hypothetical protein
MIDKRLTRGATDDNHIGLQRGRRYAGRGALSSGSEHRRERYQAQHGQP